MKKAVLLMLSLFSALSLMFLSCSTDSSGGGSDPVLDLIVCTGTQEEKTEWEIDSGNELNVYITSKNYLKDLEITGAEYDIHDDFVQLGYTLNDSSVERRGVYKLSFSGCPTEAGEYTITLYARIKSKPNSKECKFTFTLKVKGSGEDVKAMPSIIKQPVSKTYSAGTTSFDELSVTAAIATGNEIAYQWYKDSEQISGATSATFTPTSAGKYFVRVSNKDASSKYVDSNIVSIVVLNAGELYPPEISSDLSSSISYDKTSDIEKLEIKATSRDGGIIHATWYCDNVVISGNEDKQISAVNGVYTVSYTPTKFGSYYCELWVVNGENKSQKVTSGSIAVEENKMVVTIGGLSSTSYVGEELKVSVTANVETEDIAYQWYTTDASSSSDTEINGATDESYTPTETGFYKCKVTVTSIGGQKKTVDNGGTVEVVTKPVGAAEIPTITSQPESVSVEEGGEVILSVSANVNDGGELSYKWYKNGNSITDATGSSFTISSAKADDSGNYHVVVTNKLNGTTATKTSDIAVVSVSSSDGSISGGFDFN